MCLENHKGLYVHKRILPVYTATFRIWVRVRDEETGREKGEACSLSRSMARGSFSKRGPGAQGSIHVIRAGLRLCVSKQLWFEKIRRPVERKENVMRQQNPARSTTLPSSGQRGEGTSAGPGRLKSERQGSSHPFPCLRAEKALRKLKQGQGTALTLSKSVLPSPNLPPVLHHSPTCLLKSLQAALAFLSLKSEFRRF